MVIAALLLASASPPPPPPPRLPEINRAFSCRMFGSDAQAPFRVWGSARTTHPQPPKTWDEVEVTIQSDSPALRPVTQTVQVLPGDRTGFFVQDERERPRFVTYFFSVSQINANGALQILERRAPAPGGYVATGLCDLQPIEVVQ